MLKRSLETLASAIKMWVNDKFTHSHKEISNQIQEVVENLSFEVPVTSVNGMTGDVVIELDSDVTSVNGMTGDVIINPTPADWNQNKETEIDYIKNRTHYECQVIDTVYMPETEHTFSETVENGKRSTLKFNSWEESEIMRQIIVDEDNEGNVYYVLFDGIEYETTVTRNHHRGLGNHYLYSDEYHEYPNTGEPFCITCEAYGVLRCYVASSDSDTHTLSIYTKRNGVKQLDEKFIPDTIARVSDIPQGGSTIQADFIQNDETAFDYIKNRTHYVEREGWEITWDGNPDDVEIKVIPIEEEPENMFCYISSSIPSDEELKKASISAIKINNNNGAITDTAQFEISDIWNDFIAAGFITDDFAFLEAVCVIKKDNVDISGVIFPKAGVYFVRAGTDEYSGCAVALGLAPIIKKLDFKFLPDDIVGRKGAGTNAEVFNDYDDTNTASGNYSHVEGQGNTASGDYSHVEGRNNTTSGFGSHVEGVGNTASGLCSHAEGYQTTSYEYSHAEGYYTLAGYHSHAEGSETYACAGSHAEGSGTVACGGQSHAEGRGWEKRSLTLTGSSRTYKYTDNDVGLSIVGMIVVNDTGYTCWSAKIIAVDLGTKTITIDGKLCPNAMDTKTLPVYSVGVASGSCSHAEGYTIAHGDYSHAEGYYTIASGESQHVQGKYNIDDMENEYAHIVGNGENDDHRSNAHTLDWDGNAWYAGDVYIGSTSGTSRDEGSKKLATEEYVNSAIETNTSSQVDWNQNDETASDYVKGRTHWVEDPGEEVLSEVTKSFEWEDDSNYAYDTVGTARYPMVVGESYILSINGVEYERVAQAYGSDQVFIGDRNVFSGNGYFLLTYYINSNELHLRIMADGDLTLRVVKKGQRELVYHTLDEKFIPDTIARVSDIPDIPDPVDLTGYATEEYVDNTIKQIIPEGGYSVSWENITNKPFTTFTVAGPSTEFEEFYSNPSAELYEDSEGYELNHHRSLIEVRNEDCADFCMLEDGKTYKVVVDGYEGIAVAEKVAGVYNDDEAIVQLTLELNNRRIIVNTSDGIYTTGRGVERICRLSVCIYYNDSSDFYNGFIYVPIAIYKPKGVVVLDEKHIPDTIARKADVAKEVQAVMVSGDAKLFLTSPGGKKFAITITDDGTISATEVIE